MENLVEGEERFQGDKMKKDFLCSGILLVKIKYLENFCYVLTLDSRVLKALGLGGLISSVGNILKILSTFVTSIVVWLLNGK